MLRSSAIRSVLRLVLGGVCLGALSPLAAAPLRLSQVPLFLSLKAHPNIVFVIDDSGSMDWEVLTQDVANDGRLTGKQPNGSDAGQGTVRHRAGCGFGVGQSFYGYIYGVDIGPGVARNLYDDDARDCNTADDQDWRFRNADFNSLYFHPDPTRLYTPWAGVDAAGNPFRDMPVTAAKVNPYDPQSPTVDLTRSSANAYPEAPGERSDGEGFRYYTWTDSAPPNDLFDEGEATAHRIRDADPETQQRFANWFSYYRKRHFVAKAIYGDLIADAVDVRMGLVTLHNTGNQLNPRVTSVNTPLRLMNVDPTTGPKRQLLDALYALRPSGDTPLRSTLKHVGEYLANEAGRTLFPTDNAYLSEAEGGACQQSYTILLTDGLENGPDPGVGNADGDGSSAFDGGVYADAWSETLADVAMYYYERDVRPQLADRVPTSSSLDHATHQRMVTYTVTFSSAAGTLADVPRNARGVAEPPWPNPLPASQSAARIDDLRHAAWNGRGLFLAASDSATLRTRLRAILAHVDRRTSAASAIAVDAAVRHSDSRLYQARFNSGDWSGALLAFRVDDATGAPAELVWDASLTLEERLASSGAFATARTLLTYKPSTGTGIPFQWPVLDSAQQHALGVNQQGRHDAAEGQARLEYLRGSKAEEGNTPGTRNYRVRLRRLGDLIHSAPFFVGPPSLPDTVGADYRTFRLRHSNRIPMLVVGGNDGLLHIFDASPRGRGAELLGYLPNKVLPYVKELTSPQYVHRYYVDGSPTAGDVLLATPRSGIPSWRTVAVGGLRGGGQGYFALDITDPTAFSEEIGAARQTVLWEFTDEQDADLGYTYSQPSLVRLRNGRWAAIFGNGYNNTEADGRASQTGHAVLYVVFLDGPGVDGLWEEGRDYVKIDTGVGEQHTPNGLATPAAVDLDGDLTIEYIIAGDLRGNVWRFDVNDPNPQRWNAPENRRVVFQARDGAGVPQPITTRPEVGVHPEAREGFLIYVGTGKYLEAADNHTAQATPQTFYGIWDRGNATVQRAELLEQRVVQTIGLPGRDARLTSDTPIDWNRHRGWFLDFPDRGERLGGDPLLRNGRVIFTTFTPHDQVCAFGGSSFVMELDVRGGVRPEGAIFDITRDHSIDPLEDTVSVTLDGHLARVFVNGLGSFEGMLSNPTILFNGETDIQYASSAAGQITVTTAHPGAGAFGRQSWRYILQ